MTLILLVLLVLFLAGGFAVSHGLWLTVVLLLIALAFDRRA